MGLLDRARKLAEQAKEAAELVKEKAEGALAEAKARTDAARDGDDAPSPPSSPPGPSPRTDGDAGGGTRYVPGMFGRPGWRERGLVDPAAVLPVDDRDRALIPRSTRSEIVQEPFGVGRRWTAAERSAGLFYQLDDDHRSWEPPGGKEPYTAVPGASSASLDDGRSLAFLAAGDQQVVLEVKGLAEAERATLARAVAGQLG